MPYCSKCGAEVDPATRFCPKCGSPQSTGSYRPADQKYTDPHDSGSIGWFLLGFFVPLVGLILFLIWSGERPMDAKMSGLGALVGFILGIVFTIIYVVVLAGLVASMNPDNILAII